MFTRTNKKNNPYYIYYQIGLEKTKKLKTFDNKSHLF